MSIQIVTIEDIELLNAARQGNANLVRILLKAGANPAAADPEEATALHIASRKGDADVVLALLEKNASIHAWPDNIGRTPLHLAARFGHVYMVQVLLGFGADPEKMDKDGSHPIALAKWKNHVEVVAVLER